MELGKAPYGIGIKTIYCPIFFSSRCSFCSSDVWYVATEINR